MAKKKIQKKIYTKKLVVLVIKPGTSQMLGKEWLSYIPRLKQESFLGESGRQGCKLLLNDCQEIVTLKELVIVILDKAASKYLVKVRHCLLC